MKILVIGGGGREHAIVHAVSKSPLATQIFCIPGNPGIQSLAECVVLSLNQHDGIVEFVKQRGVDLTIVGPEQPLAEGLVDRFEREGLRIFGPTRRAAELESSKSFTKNFCKTFNIPTADFEVFDDVARAEAALKERQSFPVVLKADGLAAGKGVVIAGTRDDAIAALRDMMVSEKFGMSGKTVVIEDFLEGEEASFIVVADGDSFVELQASQDHKRIFDNDQGPNTGGMGAYAPAPIVTEDVRRKVIAEIIKPTLHGMQLEGRRFRGFLYAGLMISPEGEPKLIEFNCRLGDPETEVILPQLQSDFVELMDKATRGQLEEYKVQYRQGSSVCVVLASAGYPTTSSAAVEIHGLQNSFAEDVSVYHAGTKRDGDKIITNGGRVLAITAMADTLPNAVTKVYQEIEKIKFDGMQFRRDIASKAL